MKRICVLLLGVIGVLPVFAQNKGALTGTWEGVLKVGVELRLVFHIKQTETGSFTATADSPDQNAFDLPCDSVSFDSDSVTIWMNALQARFEGRLISDTIIRGQFIQGIALPLDLKKVDKPTEKVRTQIPKPPFPYTEEKIKYSNPDKSIEFGATLTIPNGKGPFPAVVLISGSGAQDRESTLMGHQTFTVLADHLSRNGVMVLRYDDRGVGQTTGEFRNATSADFAWDAGAAVDYLLQRKEADKKKLGLIGHSEGGMIAPILATSRKDIAFLVLLAAPGVPIMDLMAAQNEAVARASGIPQPALAEIPSLFRQVTTLIINAQNNEDATLKTRTFLENWVKQKDPQVTELLNLSRSEGREEYIKAMVEQLRSPWFTYFINFDPTPYLKRLKGKVLALNGTKDIQVLSSQNLPGIEAALKKSKVSQFEVHEIVGLNHLFQSCKVCSLQEYGDLEETFAPVALQMLTDWINKQIK